MSTAKGISTQQRFRNYEVQEELRRVGNDPNFLMFIGQGERLPTGRQRRRIVHKQNRRLGQAKAGPQREPRKVRTWSKIETVNLPKVPEYQECPNPTCRQKGPWSSNPCLTASGAEAKKAHKGRLLNPVTEV
jgi:hypothetical protein